jgi:hypothetical protein
MGSPSAADDLDRIETSTPPNSKARKAGSGGKAREVMVQRWPLAPMVRPPQPTAVEGVQQDAAAQALLALLGATAAAAAAAAATGPAAGSRISSSNRVELLRQARMAHHRLSLSLGVYAS